MNNEQFGCRPQQRRRVGWSRSRRERSLNDLGLGGTVREQPHFLRRQHGLQADRESPRRKVLMREVPAPTTGSSCACSSTRRVGLSTGESGLVHPEMPVEPDAEQHQIESVADRGVVVRGSAAARSGASRIEERETPTRGRSTRVDQLTLQRVPGTPGSSGASPPNSSSAKTLARANETSPASHASRHLRVDSDGRGAGRQAHLQVRLGTKTIAPQRRRPPGSTRIQNRTGARSFADPSHKSIGLAHLRSKRQRRLSGLFAPTGTRRSASRAPRGRLRRS